MYELLNEAKKKMNVLKHSISNLCDVISIWKLIKTYFLKKIYIISVYLSIHPNIHLCSYLTISNIP